MKNKIDKYNFQIEVLNILKKCETIDEMTLNSNKMKKIINGMIIEEVSRRKELTLINKLNREEFE